MPAQTTPPDLGKISLALWDAIRRAAEVDESPIALDTKEKYGEQMVKFIEELTAPE